MMKTLQIKDLKKHEENFQETLNDENCSLMLIKGAPEILLSKCATILKEDGSEAELDSLISIIIIQMQNDWCLNGQRVLLMCKKTLNSEQTSKLMFKSKKEIEDYVDKSTDFCLVGMVGIIDPPLPMMPKVIRNLREAGIKVLMITGDYAITAVTIARETGILNNDEKDYETVHDIHQKFKTKGIEKRQEKNKSLLLNGSDFQFISNQEWRLITKYDQIVFARISPEQKLFIVKEFQRDGYVVGVTGDGVNDAPALKSADIGIAMGAGSEVAMEASQLVLLDNNFSSILIAIENGRLVFYNLRKVIVFMLSTGLLSNYRSFNR